MYDENHEIDDIEEFGFVLILWTNMGNMNTSYSVMLFWWRYKMYCVSWLKMADNNRLLLEILIRLKNKIHIKVFNVDFWTCSVGFISCPCFPNMDRFCIVQRSMKKTIKVLGAYQLLSLIFCLTNQSNEIVKIES